MKLYEAKVGDWVLLIDSKYNDIVRVNECDNVQSPDDINFIPCSDIKGVITNYNKRCEVEVVENYTADGMS